MTSHQQLIARLETWAADHGIHVSEREMTIDKAGEFDGLQIVLNRDYGVEERAYYLAHSLGSILGWCLDRDRVQQMFDELEAVKEPQNQESARLESAIDAYRRFETMTSEFAVQLLVELGFRELVPGYSNFFRADIEAMTVFHRTGVAPVWREFFRRWNDGVRRGERNVMLFAPRPIPSFQPIRIETQEVLQQQ